MSERKFDWQVTLKPADEPADEKDKMLVTGYLKLRGGEMNFSFPLTFEEFAVLMKNANDSLKNILAQIAEDKKKEVQT